MIRSTCGLHPCSRGKDSTNCGKEFSPPSFLTLHSWWLIFMPHARHLSGILLFISAQTTEGWLWQENKHTRLVDTGSVMLREGFFAPCPSGCTVYGIRVESEGVPQSLSSCWAERCRQLRDRYFGSLQHAWDNNGLDWEESVWRERNG